MKYSIAIFVKNLTSGGAEKQAVVLARVLAPLYDIHFIVLNDKFTHQKYVNLLKQESSMWRFLEICLLGTNLLFLI